MAWKHHYLDIHVDSSAADMIEQLDAFGRDGYQLAGAVRVAGTDHVRYIIKREVASIPNKGRPRLEFDAADGPEDPVEGQVWVWNDIPRRVATWIAGKWRRPAEVRAMAESSVLAYLESDGVDEATVVTVRRHTGLGRLAAQGALSRLSNTDQVLRSGLMYRLNDDTVAEADEAVVDFERALDGDRDPVPDPQAPGDRDPVPDPQAPGDGEDG